MYLCSFFDLRRRSFLFLICCGFIIFCSANQESKKCVEIGEYCQNHWDCCSNSCLSFMYRCTRNFKQENAVINTRFGETSYSTINDILELHFGKPNNINPPANVINRLDVVSPSVMLTTIQPFSTMPTKKVTTDSYGLNVLAQCKEIGLKCYSNDECCTKRCHGFLHQCVT